MKLADDEQKTPFSSKEQANKVAERVQEMMSNSEKSTKCFYLQSMEHLLCQSSNSESLYSRDLIESLQQSLIDAIVLYKYNKSKKVSVWNLLEATMQKQGQSQFLGRCISGFKEALKRELVQLTDQSRQVAGQLSITLSQVQAIDNFTLMLK